MNQRAAIFPAQMLLLRTCVLSKTMSYRRPCVVKNSLMENLNQTSYCSSLSTVALLISRMMFARVGWSGSAGNTVLRSNQMLPLPSLCSMARFYTVYSFILKGTRSVFQCSSKSTRNKSKTPKAQARKARTFIIPRCFASSNHKHSDGVQSTPDSAFATPELCSPLAWQGFKRTFILEIDKSQKIHMAKPIDIINILPYPN